VTWLDHWLASKKPNVEPNTYNGYEQRARLYLKPRLGTVTLGSLTAIQVPALLAGMARDGKSAGEQFKTLQVLQAAFAEAV
jgi:hypothetical protein